MKYKMKRGLSSVAALVLALALMIPAVVIPVTVEAAPAGAARVWRFDGSYDGAIPTQIGPFPAGTPYGGTANAPTFVTDRHGNPNGAVHLNGEVGLYLGEGIINSAEYTVAMWVNPDDPLYNSFGSLFYGAVADDNWISLHPASNLGGDGNVVVWSGAGGGRWSDNISDANLIPGQWQHVAFVMRPGAVQIYLNGAPAAMTAENVPYPLRDLFSPNSEYGLPGHFFLGLNYFPDPVFAGAIDDLYIYNRALSSAEILDLYLPDAADAISFTFNNSFDGAIPTQIGPFPAATPYGGTVNTPRFVTDRHGNSNAAVHLNGEVGLYLGQGLINSAEYTVAMWVNPDDPLHNSFGSLFYGALADDNWISLHPASNLGGDGNVVVWSGAGGGRWSDNISDANLTPGQWQHIAFVMRPGGTQIYLNGVPAAMAAENVPYPLRDLFSPNSEYGLPGHFFLGLNYFPDPVFAGAIDDLHIFNRALSSGDVHALMHLPDVALAHVFTFNNDFGGAIPTQIGPFPSATPYGGTVNTPRFVADRFGNANGAVHLNGEVGLYLGEGLINSAEYTVAMWVNPDDPLHNSFGSLFYGAVADDNWVSLHPASNLGGDGNVVVWSGAGGGRWSDNISDGHLIPGQWQHIAFVMRPGGTRIYLNGVPAAMAAENVPYPLRDLFSPNSEYGLPGHFFLGLNYFPDPVFAGAIDDLVIFNHALSPEGVAALMGMVFEAGEAGEAPEPVEVSVQPLIDMLARLTSLDTLTGHGFTTLGPRWEEARNDANALMNLEGLAEWQVDGRVAHLNTNWLPFVGALAEFIAVQNAARATGELDAYLQEIVPYINRANNMLQVQALSNRLNIAMETPAEAPATPEAPANDDGGGLDTWVIIVIIIGGVIAAAAVPVASLIKKKKK
ncbi:MAG: LamG domain-containing protein [Defluviitaleaceae bacterium]|nr:LamG domain-containing protein [Defluviitaleaceae bacterium]